MVKLHKMNLLYLNLSLLLEIKQNAINILDLSFHVPNIFLLLFKDETMLLIRNLLVWLVWVKYCTIPYYS